MLPSVLGKKLKKWRKKSAHEICLMVDDETTASSYTVNVPRNLLIENSPIFKKIALGKSSKVKLDNVTPIGLQNVLKYIEKATVSFRDYDDALQTLHAAREYQVSSLQNVCIEYLATRIDRNNVCEVYQYATASALNDLIYRCLVVIDRNAESVLQTPGFMKLQRPVLIDIIKRDSLLLKSEMSVLEAVLQWARRDCHKRNVDPENVNDFLYVLEPLLGHVRFLTMRQYEFRNPKVKYYYYLLETTDESKRHSLLCESECTFPHQNLDDSPNEASSLLSVASRRYHDKYESLSTSFSYGIDDSARKPSKAISILPTQLNFKAKNSNRPSFSGSCSGMSPDSGNFSETSFSYTSDGEMASSCDGSLPSISPRSRASSSRNAFQFRESLSLPPRQYISRYVHDLGVQLSSQHPVKTNEEFHLILEVLKGHIFLIGFNLAINSFAKTKGTTCLYVLLTATNVLTSEKKSARGALLNNANEEAIIFTNPLSAKESERIEVTLLVKKAENISSILLRNNSDIVMPLSNEVAFKVVPHVTAESHSRSIFKDILYFF